MRLRKIPGIETKIAEEYPGLVMTEPGDIKGNWKSHFKNDNPVSLEIGMGRGQFVAAMSTAFEDKNFVALEMRNEVIYDAAQKLGTGRPNVAVVSARAETLPQWFAPGEVSDIYLNFSDPWPKRAHRKRRLTHEVFLNLYREILCDGGNVFFRTDVPSLMEFSLTEMTNHGFSLEEISLDFHGSKYFDGITTEYEDKKSKYGPVYYGRFVLKK